jgi:YidC/Oxa1 family membrane protein insertase
MFQTLIVQPIFNLLVFIYAILPGHNFGLALIIFTGIIRLLLWPLVKKQLHQAKRMRAIQPELKRIAEQTKNDKQKRALMQMELYKERGISPFSSIGVALLQLPILFGLYIGLQKVISDNHQMVDFAYPFLQQLSWLKELKANIHLFDASLFGIVDLTKAAVSREGIYIPALIIVTLSAVTQYYQAKQLMPDTKDARKLRDIMRDAGQGKQADQTEVSAAIGRSTRYFLPAMIFIFTINIPSALGLYWFVGGLIAFMQQSYVLNSDKEEMEALSETSVSKRDVSRIPEGEIISNKGKKRKHVQPLEAVTAPTLPKTENAGKVAAAQNSSTKSTFKQTPGSTVTNITRSKKSRRK